mgnify:CR=1 FL=1
MLYFQAIIHTKNNTSFFDLENFLKSYRCVKKILTNNTF